MKQSISAKIQWNSRDEAEFTEGKYSRIHLWELESGTQLHASSSPHIVPLPFSNPDFIDPEEAFICSLASCHMLFFLSIAAKKKLEVVHYDDQAIGTLAKNESGHICITQVILQPKVLCKQELSEEQLHQIHHLAHKNCFIARSVNSNIQIKPQI